MSLEKGKGRQARVGAVRIHVLMAVQIHRHERMGGGRWAAISDPGQVTSQMCDVMVLSSVSTSVKWA